LEWSPDRGSQVRYGGGEVEAVEALADRDVLRGGARHVHLIAALTFASVLGWGVLLSAGTVLIVQGSLTLGAAFLDAVVTEPMISATTDTGGILIFGLGLVLLDLKEVRVANMLPALLFAPLLVAAAPLWPL